MLKHELHKNICKAILKTLETYKKTDYDDSPSYKIIENYFHDVKKGIDISLAPCPDDESLKDIFKHEIESMKGYL